MSWPHSVILKTVGNCGLQILPHSTEMQKEETEIFNASAHITSF